MGGWRNGARVWPSRAPRILAEGELDTERTARMAEQSARILAEGELDAERAARIAEQSARQAAEQEAARLQEVIRRLREGQGK